MNESLMAELNRSVVTVWSKSEQAFHMWQDRRSCTVVVIDANGKSLYTWNMNRRSYDTMSHAYGAIVEYICDTVNG
jgi:hypothetical protein